MGHLNFGKLYPNRNNMKSKIINLIVLFFLVFVPVAFSQKNKCNDIDTNSIVNEVVISINSKKEVAAIDNSYKIRLFQNSEKKQLKLVAGAKKDKTVFTLQYQLLEADEYNDTGCYLLIRRVVLKSKKRVIYLLDS